MFVSDIPLVPLYTRLCLYSLVVFALLGEMILMIYLIPAGVVIFVRMLAQYGGYSTENGGVFSMAHRRKLCKTGRIKKLQSKSRLGASTKAWRFTTCTTKTGFR